VTVDRVIDPLEAGRFDRPVSSKSARFVGVEIAIENTGSKTYSDAPSNGARVALGVVGSLAAARTLINQR
jgi:hypothetical protein